MKRLLSAPLLHILTLALIVLGVAIALPLAHAAGLHAPHAGAADRDCSLSACGAFLPHVFAPLLAIVLTAIALLDLRSSAPLSIPLIIDPPPRLARA